MVDITTLNSSHILLVTHSMITLSQTKIYPINKIYGGIIYIEDYVYIVYIIITIQQIALLHGAAWHHVIYIIMR